jgi:hypothetical protein
VPVYFACKTETIASAPCNGCSHAKRCAVTEEICPAYLRYVFGGYHGGDWTKHPREPDPTLTAKAARNEQLKLKLEAKRERAGLKKRKRRRKKKAAKSKARPHVPTQPRRPSPLSARSASSRAPTLLSHPEHP